MSKIGTGTRHTRTTIGRNAICPDKYVDARWLVGRNAAMIRLALFPLFQMAAPAQSQPVAPVVSGKFTDEDQIDFDGGLVDRQPQAIIGIRHVVWPPPTHSRPSIVVYVFTPDDLGRALAYGWADPGAVRLAIKQRWV